MFVHIVLNHEIYSSLHILPKCDIVDLEVSETLYASTDLLAVKGLMALNHFPTGLQLCRLPNKEVLKEALKMTGL